MLDDDTNFMQEDEEMITIMDSDRFIDSIRLLTCKYRITHSNPEWLSNFCTSGGNAESSFLFLSLFLIYFLMYNVGISVLVENMDNRLDKVDD